MEATICAFVLSMLVSNIHMRSVSPPPPRHRGVFPPSYQKEEVERNVKTWSPQNKWNVWEKSGLFEGDIMQERNPHLRNGLRNENRRWPNATVPYYISEKYFSEAEIRVIENGIEEYHNKTCIKFRPYEKEDKDYVSIEAGTSGCWSYVGRNGGGQVVNLETPGCVFHSVVVHELLHALGFYHQQSAHDRDDYVKINWENIKPGKEGNFEKLNSSIVTSYDVPYDYGSIMHYSETAFSKNGKPTITPLQKNVTLGRRDGLSDKDITKLGRMYGCAEAQELGEEEEHLEVEEKEEEEEKSSLWTLFNSIF